MVIDPRLTRIEDLPGPKSKGEMEEFKMPYEEFCKKAFDVGKEHTKPTALKGIRWLSCTMYIFTPHSVANLAELVAQGGGNFTVDGVYWGITAVVQTPGAPLLKSTLTDTNVVVSWPSPSAGYVLQHNSVIGTTNWTDYGGPVADEGTTKRVTRPAGSGNLFLRLRK